MAAKDSELKLRIFQEPGVAIRILQDIIDRLRAGEIEVENISTATHPQDKQKKKLLLVYRAKDTVH